MAKTLKQQSNTYRFQFPVQSQWCLVLPANSKRLWASLTFWTTVGTGCFVNLERHILTDPVIAEDPQGEYLLNHDTFLLDKTRFEWTGEVWAYLNAAAVTGEELDVIEVESL